MAIKRYARTPILGGGTLFGTSYAASIIKHAVDVGSIRTRVVTLQGAERLDIIAGREYGDASSWWVVAAASGIGWALQVPPGTRIVIPTDLSEVADLVS